MPIQLPSKGEYQLNKYLTDNYIVMSKIKITQIKSCIGSNKRQKATLKALGLHKMQQTVEHDATPQIIGMANKLRHLVKIEQE